MKAIMEGLTTFKIESGDTGIKVVKKFNGKPIRETYALDYPQAEFIRQTWVNEFWGVSNNVLINQLCCQ